MHSRSVFGRACDDNERGTRLLADHCLGQSLLTRSLNEHGGVIADATVEQRPLDAVRHGGYKSRQFRCDALWNMVQNCVPRKIYVLAKSAPQMGRLLGRGVAIADSVGVEAPIGVLTVTVLSQMAPLAFAAHDVVLHEHQVPFLEAFAPDELPAGLGDVANVLVTHNHGGVLRRWCCVQLNISPANAGDLHLHQGAVLQDLRHWEFADLGFAWSHSYCR